jgi:hypothetical protein
MLTEARSLPGACKYHVDEINKALASGRFDEAFYLAYQYGRARFKAVQEKRPQDADGLRAHGAHLLAEFAGTLHTMRPNDEFRSGTPLIPGGDWTPGAAAGRP